MLHLEVGSKPLFKVFFLNKSMPYAIVSTALLFPCGLTALALYLLPPLVSVLLALGFLSVVAYSQNTRINQYLDRVKRLRRRETPAEPLYDGQSACQPRRRFTRSRYWLIRAFWL